MAREKMIRFFEIALVFALFTSSYSLQRNLTKPLISLSKEEHSITVSGTFLRMTDVGQHRMMSAWHWIITLIESDQEHHHRGDKNSWLYLRFKTISELEPLFLDNYLVGGQYLAIVKDAPHDALEHMLKGYDFYPNDPWLNYYIGFTYYFEFQDAIKAIPYFKNALRQISDVSKMGQLPSLLAKIQASVDDLNEAYELAYNVYQRAEEESLIKKKLSITLYALKAEIDLKCLHSKKESCSKVDFFDLPYILKSDGSYIAQKNWKPARPRRIRAK